MVVGVDKELRPGREALAAFGGTEMIVLSLVDGVMRRRGRIDAHPADGINRFGGRGGVRMAAAVIRFHARPYGCSSNWKVKPLIAEWLRLAYFSAMRFTRLFQILALFALLFAPAGMLGSHSAMAMPNEAAAATMNHCADQQAPAQEDRQAMLDCAIACTAMPADEPFFAPEQMVASPALLIGPIAFFDGSAPELATPPPRLF
jgi:hypothetical protein